MFDVVEVLVKRSNNFFLIFAKCDLITNIVDIFVDLADQRALMAAIANAYGPSLCP